MLAAGRIDSAQSAEALQKLCLAYWYPLYAYARRTGQVPADAEDVTQGFFARLLERDYLADVARERGRFRSFLLASFKHFQNDEWKSARRQKRGGGLDHLSMDAQTAEERYRLEPADPLDAERLFQRRWAMTILDQALERLETELAAVGRQKVFVRLQDFLVGNDTDGTYAEAAHDLNSSEAAVKMTVSRLRKRARELIRDEIAQTVSTAAEVEEEYRALIESLRG